MLAGATDHGGWGTPQQIAVDESTNRIYVENQSDGTVSVIDGSHCNGTDVSGCNQAWPTIAVGASPQGLGFNPRNHTLYVTNTDDNTVSVINTTSQNVVATFPTGAAPRAVGIVFDRNTVFIGNRDDLTVSIVDGSTCNGTNTSGCPQSPPPAVLVGAFPDSAGNDQKTFWDAALQSINTNMSFLSRCAATPTSRSSMERLPSWARQ